MITSKLTELLIIETLITTISDGGEVANVYQDFKTIYGSVLNDSATDNNQSSNTSFNNQTTYNDRVRFYIRYLPLTFDNNVKKQFRVTWNGNHYYITGIRHVANRSATIIDCSSNV